MRKSTVLTLAWMAVTSPTVAQSVREQRLEIMAPVVAAVALDWEGATGVAVATGGKDEQGSVVFVPDGDGEPRELAAGLAGLDSLATLDADRDGRPETLLAGHPGGVWVLPGGAAVKALDGDGIDLRSVQRGTAMATELVVSLAGEVRWYRAEGTRLIEQRKVPTPQRLRPTPTGMQFEGARAVAIEDGGLVVGPLERGSGRLETALIDVGGNVRTAWSLLPPGFRVSRSDIVTLAGKPVLLVAGAMKFGVFVDAEVLVFSLAPDPSGRGFGPVARLETPCAFWNPPRLERRRNGAAEELVATCPKGVTGGELWAGVWEVGVGGRPRAPRSGDLDLQPEVQSAAFDLDGDGVGDLVAIDEEGAVAWYRGRDRGRPFEKRAAASWPLREQPPGVTEVSVAVGGEGAEASSRRSPGRVIALFQPKPGVVVAARGGGGDASEVVILRWPPSS